MKIKIRQAAALSPERGICRKKGREVFGPGRAQGPFEVVLLALRYFI